MATADGRCSPSQRAAVALLVAALVGLPAEAVVLRRAAPTDAESPWPAGLSLTPAPGVPERQWFLESEDDSWGRRMHEWRKKLLARSEVYGQELTGLSTDDIPDTFLWRGLDKFQPHNQQAFWDAMCNGTMKMLPSNKPATSNCSFMDGSGTSSFYPCLCGGITCRVNEICTVGETPTCKAKLPLDDYKVMNGSSCAPENLLPGKEITNERKAFESCGGMCSAVMDIGCERKYFRLCKIGKPFDEPKQDANASNVTNCLRLRMPDHPPPGGGSRGPLELKFWKTFCEASSIVKFRPLFKGRLCSSGKDLPEGALSEPKCAEVAAADASCGPTFDFADGKLTNSPNVCRCLAAGAACSAPAPVGKPDPYKNVYIRDMYA